MNVLLIGANGFLGTHLLRALRLAGSNAFNISTVSRTGAAGGLPLNLEDPAHFPRLRGYDAVVNCASIHPDRYELLIRYCFANQIRFLDTTADPQTIRVLTAFKKSLPLPNPTGLFLFGIGIFPGISNLLIKQELAKAQTPTAAILAINYKVASGAGRGMCQLMIDTIASPCRWFENGEDRQSRSPFHSLIRLPFGNRLQSAIQVNIGEIDTIHDLLPPGSVRTYISFRPSLLNRPCYHIFNAIARSGPLKRPLLRLLYYQFYFTRARLLKNTTTDIRIICRVTNNDDITNHPTTSHAELYFKDAMLAAGQFSAALLRLLDESPDLRGIYASEDCWDLKTILPLIGQTSPKLPPH